MAILKRRKSTEVKPKRAPLPTAEKKAGATSPQSTEKKAHFGSLIKGGSEHAKTTRTLAQLKTVLPVSQSQSSPPISTSFSDVETSVEMTSDPLLDQARLQAQLAEYRQTELSKISLEVTRYRQEQFANIDTERRNLHDEAYDEGYQSGEEAGYHQLSPQLDAVMSSINQIEQQKQKMISEFKPQIITLALAMAEKITKAYLSDHPDQFNAIVDEALTRITDKEKVVIRVNPQQADTVRKNKEAIQIRLPDIKTLEIHEDNKIEFGGCMIETKMGYVDATLKIKLETLSKLLFDRYNEENPRHA